jgi:hypothetical protein
VIIALHLISVDDQIDVAVLGPDHVVAAAADEGVDQKGVRNTSLKKGS